MGLQSLGGRESRPLRPGLMPGGVVALYLSVLFGLKAAFLLRPESRVIEALLLAWCWLFLAFAIVVLACLMVVFGLAICRSGLGRVGDVAIPPKGFARRVSVFAARSDPLWDRGMDG